MDVGIDIGGSKVAVVTASPGKPPRDILWREHSSKKSVEMTLGLIREMVDDALPSGSAIGHVGAAFAGMISQETGKVLLAPNLRAWEGKRLGLLLGRALGTSHVHVENDANSGAWAEYSSVDHAGGKGSLLYVVLGTGIGAGVIMDGKLWRGSNGVSAEIGHIPGGPGQTPCTCGGTGCIEAMCSGWALGKQAQRMMSKDPGSLLGRICRESGGCGAKELLFAAERGYSPALSLRESAGLACGKAIGSAVTLFGVPTVVIGGSLLRNAPGYVSAIKRGIRSSVIPALTRSLDIRVSRIHRYGAAMGALLLARTGATGVGHTSREGRMVSE